MHCSDLAALQCRQSHLTTKNYCANIELKSSVLNMLHACPSCCYHGVILLFMFPSPLVPAALGKREKQRLAAQAAAGDKGSGAALTASIAERDFTKLTELADLLLNAGGELDIYSHRKEQLERWAAAVLPQTNVLQGEAGHIGRIAVGLQELPYWSTICHASNNGYVVIAVFPRHCFCVTSDRPTAINSSMPGFSSSHASRQACE